MATMMYESLPMDVPVLDMLTGEESDRSKTPTKPKQSSQHLLVPPTQHQHTSMDQTNTHNDDVDEDFGVSTLDEHDDSQQHTNVEQLFVDSQQSLPHSPMLLASNHSPPNKVSSIDNNVHIASGTLQTKPININSQTQSTIPAHNTTTIERETSPHLDEPVFIASNRKSTQSSESSRPFQRISCFF